jgi:hypothetical protein
VVSVVSVAIQGSFLMTTGQDFNRLYTDVSGSIAKAMKELENIEIEHKEGKKALSQVLEKLVNIKSRFDGELGMLAQHAEWDKFTMAFFGETNAGKSTILESLRILLKEESREQLLQQNAHDLDKYEQALIGHVNQVRERLTKVCADYAAEIAAIQKGTARLALVLQQESSARITRKLRLYFAGGVCAGVVIGAMLAAFITLWVLK